MTEACLEGESRAHRRIGDYEARHPPGRDRDAAGHLCAVADWIARGWIPNAQLGRVALELQAHPVRLHGRSQTRQRVEHLVERSGAAQRAADGPDGGAQLEVAL